ncbi:hypothetical protein HK104_011025, partial [Borealophlyctis nickersoniae]
MEEKRYNISELAEDSFRKEERSRFPRVPLTVLAPVLVLVALLAVIVPNNLILSSASHDTTQELSDNYLTSLMNDVQTKMQYSVQRLFPILQVLSDIPGVTRAMTTNFNNLTDERSIIDISTQAVVKFNVDSMICMTARWAPGFSDGSPINSTTVMQTGIVAFPNPLAKTDEEKKVPAIGILDYSRRGLLRVFIAGSDGKLPTPLTTPSIPPQPYDLSQTLSMRAQLGPISGAPPRKTPFFS